jgi:hypothetical protein
VDKVYGRFNLCPGFSNPVESYAVMDLNNSELYDIDQIQDISQICGNMNSQRQNRNQLILS